jgi:hypothetical protein
MILHHLVVDEFFEEPLELRNWALARGFKDETSPADGVDYRGVCKDLPWVFRMEAELKLTHLMHTAALIKLAFCRLAMKDINPTKRLIHLDPHYAQYLLTVYLNPKGEFPNSSATLIFKHKATGMETAPTTKEEVDVWDRDCNDRFLWDIEGVGTAAWNRAIVLPTTRFHAAMPPGGFGYTPAEGRMVFVAFFDI